MPDLALARARVHGLAIALGMAMAGSALGNPQGPNVVHGTATFSSPSAGVLNITNSPQAIINWQAFGIDPGQITRFIQQNAGSAVLNRVVGADPSAILGSLYSNGRVFLVNPNGIVFGPNAVVDTAGLIASTLNMSNEDFLAGRMNFEGGPDSGSVINKGYIKAGRNGDVVLIAPQVENHGIIESDGGNLMLAAGEKVLITSIDNPEVTFEVQAPEHRALNMGQMIANGGAASVFAGSITQAGQISANALEVGEGGRIMLVAKADVTLEAGSTTTADGGTGGTIHVESSDGTAWVHGEVSARGSDGQGGDIRLLGDRVGVFDDAVVDASGEAGGGQVLVGGDFQGANPDVKNADHTAVGENATLRADAGETGDGGKVIVWADGFTEMHGTISARGGELAGDGGFVEISGKENLALTGFADVRAPNGEAGTVLLDPRDIIVDGGVGTVAGNNTFLLPTPGAIVNMGASVIAGLLQGGANVVLEANNDITISNAITVNPPIIGGHSLKLEAGRDINIDANITFAVAGDLTIIGNTSNVDRVVAQRGGGTGNIFFAAGIDVDTGGGVLSVELQDGSTVGVIDLAGSPGITSLNSSGGNITLSTPPGGAIQFGSNSEANSAGGNIVLATNSLSLQPVMGTNPRVDTRDLVSPPGDTAGNVTLRPVTTVAIDVAVGTPTAPLEISQTELNNINVSATNPGTIIIGDAAAGKITVGDYDATLGGARDFTLKSGGSVEIETQLIGPIGTLTVELDLDNTGAEVLDLSTVADLSANLSAATVNFFGGMDGNDTLKGNGQANTWTVTGVGTGNVDGLNFTNFGILDGGAGNDEIDYSGLTPVGADVILDGLGGVDGFNGRELNFSGFFENIDLITADPLDGGQLTGANLDNTWNITGADAGNVTAGAQTVGFSGFEEIGGGTADDDFRFNDNVLMFRVTGNGANTFDTVNLSAWMSNPTNFEVRGLDTFLVNSSMNVSGVGRIIGGTGSGNNVLDLSGAGGPVTVDLQAGTSNFISEDFLNFQDFIGNPMTVDELIGTGNTSTWTVSAASSGDIDFGTLLFSSFENLTGGASGDDFILDANVGGSVIGGAGPDTITINADQGGPGLDLVFEAESIFNSPTNVITANKLTLTRDISPDTMILQDMIATDVNELAVNNVNGVVNIMNTNGPTTLVEFSGGSPSDPSNVTISNDDTFVIAPGVNLQASGFVDISTSAGDIDLSGASISTSNGFDLDAGGSVFLGTIIDSSAASSFVTASDSIVNTTGGGTNITTGGFVTLTAPTIGTIADPIEIVGPFSLVDAGTEFGVKHIGDFFMSGFVLDGAGPGLFEVMSILDVGSGNDFGANQIVRADTMNIVGPITASGPLTLEANQLNVLNDIDASGSTLTLETSNELNIISDAEIGPVNVNATDLIIDAPIISVLANGNFVKLDASNSILINGDSLTVQGGDGSGDFASIDPVSLVLNLSGPLSVIGGAGQFATADLVADSIDITASQVTVQGGTGFGSQAHITALAGTLDLIADSVLITAGTGLDADAYIGALDPLGPLSPFGALTITAATCVDCTVLLDEPTIDGMTEQGVFGDPVTIGLPVPPVPPVPPPTGGGTPSEPPLVEEQPFQEVATRGTLQGLDGFPFPRSRRYPDKAPADDETGMCT